MRACHDSSSTASAEAREEPFSLQFAHGEATHDEALDPQTAVEGVSRVLQPAAGIIAEWTERRPKTRAVGGESRG